MHRNLEKLRSFSPLGHLSYTLSLFCFIKIKTKTMAECNTKLRLLAFTFARLEHICSSDCREADRS